MKQKTRIIIYIAIAVTVLVSGILAVLSSSQGAAEKAQKIIDLGNKYLIELSYDKAVIEFNKAIEIEPKNADAYIGLAEAYIGLGDTDSAIDALERGLEQTGDERIKAMLDELLPSEDDEDTSAGTTVITTEKIAETTNETPKEEFITIKGQEYSTLEEFLSLYDVCEDDLIDLNKMVNLRYLSLVFTDISDISFLGEYLERLSKLEDLTLYGDNITDIGFVKNLTGLKSLSLPRSNIIDISAVQNLTNLERLSFGSATDIGTLSFLSNLKYLSFSVEGAFITDISPIGNLINLEEINISCVNTQIYGNSPLSDISPLSNLKKLKKLSLNGHSINDISVLSNLTQLTQLDLADNQISSLEPLTNLTNLERLNLSKNQLTNLYGIENLTNLSYLWLVHNHITDITGIKNLTNLRTLNLDNYSWIEKQRNKIYDLSEIGYLTELDELYLEIVDDADISALSNLSKLEYLHLGGNSTISDVTPLHQLTNLNILKVCGVTNQDLDLLKQSLPNCQVSR